MTGHKKTTSEKKKHKSIDPQLAALAQMIVNVRKEAALAGIFVEDRELLDCPGCGLLEDVLIDGRLVTVHKNGSLIDSGLRFKKLPGKKERYLCPSCGEKVEIVEKAFE